MAAKSWGDAMTSGFAAGTTPRASRLRTIDALRGAAALGVVLFHASDVPGMSDDGRVYAAIEWVLNWGRYGVWLFFVISGFCIHLSWATRSHHGPAPIPSFGAFWLRRFRRLYPAYFAAIVLYVVCLYAEDAEFTSRLLAGIGLHLVFLQNIVPWGMYTVNEVMWTLAIEEQLYLLYFPFLYVRIRFGWAAALIMVFGARLLWFALAFMLSRVWSIEILVTQAAAAQWGIWVLGALGVEAWLGLIVLPAWSRRWSVAVPTLLIAAAVSYAYMYVLADGPGRDAAWLVSDVLWGLGFFVLVNTVVLLEDRVSGSARWLAGVGLYSYSLYLTHELVTQHAWRYLLNRLPQIGNLPSLVSLAILAGCSLVLAKLFFLVFERPYLFRARPGTDLPVARVQYGQ